MKLSVLLTTLCHIIVCSTIFAQELDNETLQNIPQVKPTEVNTTLSYSTSAGEINNTEDLSHNYEYVLYLQYYMKEVAVPDYIISAAYSSSNIHNLATSDIIHLLRIATYTLDDTIRLAQSVNKSREQFTVDDFKFLLDFVNITFPVFYDRVKAELNLDGPVMIKVFEAVGIDPSQFSASITFGSPNIFALLKNGTFGEINLKQALAETNYNASIVHNIVRDVFVNQLKSNSLEYYNSKFYELGSGKSTYYNLWHTFNVSTEDVYSVDKFRDILMNITSDLNKNLSIGLQTGPNRIIVYKKIYERFHHVANITTIVAHSGTNFSIIQNNLTVTSTAPNNYVALHSNTYSSIFVKTPELFVERLSNCTYITFNDSHILSQSVEVSNNSLDSITVQKSNGTIFNEGSPLICNDTLFGLAREQHDENYITFDTLYSNPGGHFISSARIYPSCFINSVLIFFTALVLLL